MKLRVPGDKSLTQRALILAGLAGGESRLRGLLWGGDSASTAGALRALGVGVDDLPEGGGEVRVQGVGLRGLTAPKGVLDLGNSGTGARLLLGALAGSTVEATLTGDASLRARPMDRITDPLRAMGASLEHPEREGRLPVTLHAGSRLGPLDWASPVASAQVKSALLLAGVTSGAFVMVTEPRRSRDHTERMLTALGAPVVGHAVAEGWRVELRDPPDSLRPLDFRVPGDVSSAAFLLALAALGGTPEPITVEGIGLNPTRTAFLDVLSRMGAALEIEADSDDGLEPVGSVRAGVGELVATEVGADEVPRLIDELPLVAILAARAEGTTRISGATELRRKESDRIAALAENLGTLGVEVEERADGLDVTGTDRPLVGRARVRGDHRIAMAFGVLGALPGNRIEVDDPGAADVSFPGFWDVLRRAAAGSEDA